MTPAEEIREAVLERYLQENCAYSSAPEIATWLKWSESKVRKVLRENFGAVNGTEAKRGQVARKGGGEARVWVYVPARSLLADRLIEARRTLRHIVSLTALDGAHARDVAGAALRAIDAIRDVARVVGSRIQPPLDPPQGS